MIYFFISLVTFFCFQILKSRKALITIEENKYDVKKYKNWLFQRENFATLEIAAILIVIICIFHGDKVAGISAVVFYMILSLLEIREVDKKFKFNKNNIKIIIPTIIIYLIFFGIIITDYMIVKDEVISFNHTTIYYLITVVIGYLSYLIILLSLYLSNIGKKKAKKGKKTKSKAKS